MRIGYLFFILLCITTLPVCAKTADELRAVEKQLDEKKHQQEALDASAREASKNIVDLRQRMIAATQAIQDKETEQDTLEDRLDDLAQQITQKSKDAAKDHKQLSLMTSALVEIAARPPESLFLRDRVATDHIHRSLLLKAILPRLREEAEIAAHDLATLYDLQAQMAEQKRLLEAARENLQKQQHDLDQMVATRQGFLQKTEEQKAEVAQHLADLADEARDLRQLMEKVAPQKGRKNKAAPVGTIALHWPVSGAVRKHFGDKDIDGVVSEGLTLAAPSGAPVVAPRAGRVVFAGAFRGYGQIVILQHEGGYHSFLSGFGRIDAEMGEDVEAAEPLGVLPVKPGAKPELYFEWRHGDEPVDPVIGLNH